MNPREEWQLDTHQLGRRVLLYEEVDSTSSRCAALADDERHHGLVVLARSQTAGRGQYGRSWLCQPDMGVLLSVLLFPPPRLRRPAILTAWAAVSVCRWVQQTTGLPTHIKWPNDVLLRGKKICGILIEQTQGVVAGIGLNLNQTGQALQANQLPDAASLRMFTGRVYDIPAAARELIHTLDQTYRTLLEDGPPALEADWKNHLGLLGREVRIETVDGTQTGKLLDATLDAVVLETEDGYPLLVTPEKIRHIRIDETKGESG